MNTLDTPPLSTRMHIMQDIVTTLSELPPREAHKILEAVASMLGLKLT